MWRFGPNDAASCVIIDILFFHCSFVDMLNIISTCRDILCVDINVDKRCVDHSTSIDAPKSTEFGSAALMIMTRVMNNVQGVNIMFSSNTEVKN